MKRVIYGLVFVVSLLLMAGCCPNNWMSCEPSCGSCNVSSVGWY